MDFNPKALVGIIAPNGNDYALLFNAVTLSECVRGLCDVCIL